MWRWSRFRGERPHQRPKGRWFLGSIMLTCSAMYVILEALTLLIALYFSLDRRRAAPTARGPWGRA